jgi:hypothetical protein
LLALLVLLALLAACGSSGSSGSDLRTAVAGLTAAIRTYDASPQHDIAQTAATCDRARSAIAGYTALLNPSSSSQSLNTDLKNAYKLALAGFEDCAASAPYDYQRMLKAQDELAAANTWIASARTAK